MREPGNVDVLPDKRAASAEGNPNLDTLHRTLHGSLPAFIDGHLDLQTDTPGLQTIEHDISLESGSIGIRLQIAGFIDMDEEVCPAVKGGGPGRKDCRVLTPGETTLIHSIQAS
jgi:hypothetical protein